MLERLCDKVMTFIEHLCAALIAGTVVLIAAQVICRYVLLSPISWSEQLARYIFIWVCMLGAPLALHKGATYNFDVLITKLPDKILKCVHIFNDFIAFLFCAYWAYWSVQIVIKSGWRATSGVVVKMGWLYGAQIVCAVLLMFVLFCSIVTGMGRLSAKKAEGGGK